MMRENELRLGNLVNYCNSECVLDAELFLQLLKYTTPFEPIPLTEKWLLNFGFKLQFDEYYYFDGYYVSFSADLPLWFGQEGCCQKETIKENIKYVHQLQNLYFGLTNEELTIK